MSARGPLSTRGLPPGEGSASFPPRSCAGCAALLLVSLAAHAQQPALPRAPMHVGFTRSAFSGVNLADAEAAFLAFARTVGRQRGYDLDTGARLYESVPDLEASIGRGEITLVVANAWEYLGMHIDDEMEPAFVHLTGGALFKEYVLLARRDGGLHTLADLRGKDIMVMGSAPGGLVTAWLQGLLLEQGREPLSSFFGKLETAARPSAVVLPVFFGAKPACVVDRQTLATMAELNPQLGTQLGEVAASEPFLDSITFVRRHGYERAEWRRELLTALAELHLEPAGRQILTLFKVDQLVPFKKEYLDTARALRAKLARLEVRQALQGAARSPSAPDKTRNPGAPPATERDRP